jgi:predicted DNA binding CopG/RHH family protein
MRKKLPVFKSSEAEALFWEKHDITEYVDQEEFQIVNPKKIPGFNVPEFDLNQYPKPRKTLFTMRLDENVLKGVKNLAQKRNLKYQQLLRDWIIQQFQKEVEDKK